MAVDLKPWVHALGVSDKLFLSWKSETPKGGSVTFWCLKNGKINSDAYLSWAMEHYGLASVGHDVTKRPPPLELWSHIQSVANWSAELMPLGEWDGVIFVGCVEPLADDVKWSFPVKYVLADARTLEQLWTSVQTPATVQTPAPVESPMTEQAPEQAPEFSAPEGIHLNLSSEPSSPSTSEAPEGLNLVAIKAYPVVPPGPPDDFQTQSRVVLGPDGLTVPSNEDLSPAPAPSGDAPKPQGESSLDPHVRNIFNELKAIFTRSLFMRFQGKEFQVSMQDGGWSPVDGQAHEWFGLQDPSVFRIVARTGLPYHGYVSSSAFNDEFFRLWGMNSLPEHLTIVPIKVGGHVVAAFLSVGGKELNTEKILRQTEKIVEKIKTYLNSTTASAA